MISWTRFPPCCTIRRAKRRSRRSGPASTGRTADFAQEEEPARRQILRDNLASELHATAAALHRIARRDLATRDYTLTGIRRGLTEILVHFPVYRIYAGHAGGK